MQLPFPLNPPNACTVLLTDTAEQSHHFLSLDHTIHSHSKHILLETTPLKLLPGELNHVQRDLLSDLHLAKLSYAIDMAIHLAPMDDNTINSQEACRVQWWRKSRSGKVETGQGFLKKANNQLIYTTIKPGQPTTTSTPPPSLPTSTFNLFMNDRQSEQKASVVLPHFKAQKHQKESFGGEAGVQGPLPGFDSDDPDADLDI